MIVFFIQWSSCVVASGVKNKNDTLDPGEGRPRSKDLGKNTVYRLKLSF